MNVLEPLDIDKAPDGSRDVLDSVAGSSGEVSNLYRVFAHSPSVLRAYVALDKLVSDCNLSPAERRVAMLAASFENRCEYCMAAHSAGADNAGLDEDTLEALREGRQIKGNDRLEALRVFTAKVVRQRGQLADADVREFLDADFDAANILDIILITAMKVLSNYTNHVAGTPLDERFEDMRWEPAPQREPEAARPAEGAQPQSPTRH